MHKVDNGAKVVEEVAPGVYMIRVPIPRHSLGWTHCYVYASDGAAAVIDPGWPADASWAGIEAGLDAIGVRPGYVEMILLTHAHRDHSGLAGALRRVSGAWIGLHGDDVALLPRVADDVEGHRAHARRVEAWLEMVGAPPGEHVSGSLPVLPDPVSPDRVLLDGDALDVPGGRLIVHWTPGHTPGHACFEDRERGLLFTGDHVLPRISPNISVMVGHRDLALSDYLMSLERVSRIDVEQVLPGHEYAFTALDRRVSELLDHHRARLDEVQSILRSGDVMSTFEVTRRVRWSRRWEDIGGLQLRAAVGEILAHLYYLERAGSAGLDRDGGVLIWSAAEPSADAVVPPHAQQPLAEHRPQPLLPAREGEPDPLGQHADRDVAPSADVPLDAADVEAGSGGSEVR